MRTGPFRRLTMIVAAAGMICATLVAIGSVPASAAPSAGCAQLNDPAVDAIGEGSFVSFAQFDANDVLQMTARPIPGAGPQTADLTLYPNGLPVGTVVSHLSALPGTLTYVVPATGMLELGWTTGDGSSAQWSVSCTPFGQQSTGCHSLQILDGSARDISSFGGDWIKGEQVTASVTSSAPGDHAVVTMDGVSVADSPATPSTITFAVPVTGIHDFDFHDTAGAITTWHFSCAAWQPLATTTTVTAAPTSSVVGQPVSFAISVAGQLSNIPPTGTVAVFVDGSTASAVTLNAADPNLTYSQAFTSTGTHTVSAVYSGDTYNLASSQTVQLDVAPAATTTSLGATPTTQAPGQPVALSGAVAPSAPGAGTPSGTVTIFDGATPVVSATLSSGTYSTSVSTLTSGPHTLHAVYQGDSGFAPSSSADIGVTITRLPTTVIADPALLAVGSGLHVKVTVAVLTAHLSDATTHQPIAGQQLVFRSGSTELCAATTTITGAATCTTSVAGAALVVLRGGYTATYLGNASYEPAAAAGGLIKL